MLDYNLLMLVQGASFALIDYTISPKLSFSL